MELRAKQQRQAELDKIAETLTPEEIERLIEIYEKKTGRKALNPAPQPDKFVQFLNRQDFHILCPYCKDRNYYAHGNSDNWGIRFYCNNCKKAFSPFTGTLVQGSGIPWEVWVELVYCTLNNTPLIATKHLLEADYGVSMTQETILTYRHKIQKAIALTYPIPKLSGVVQVDETYFREGQKGSRNLINVAPTVISKREARLQSGSNASELGIFGPEFCCVVVGTEKKLDDNRKGHIAAVVTGLGKSTSQAFEEYFAEYIGNITFLCSDGYEAYSRYCENNNIPHYVRMSEWKKAINREMKAYKDRYKVDITEETVREKLYGTRQIDYVDNFTRLSYKQFEELKTAKGLTLDDIDNYHSELKLKINKELRGVSTVYLYLYIAFRVFVHNWKVDHGSPPSSKKDAEEIFTELLLAGENFVSRKELGNSSILDNARPTTKFINHLKKATDEVRIKSRQAGFVFDDNERLIYFNKRRYFENAPMVRLKEVAKLHHIKGYTKMTAGTLAKEICKLPEVNDIFLGLVAADKLHSQYVGNLAEMLENEDENKG